MLIYPNVNCICDTLLVQLLGSRLGEPTLAESPVMAKPAACGSRCRPRFPHQRVSPNRGSAAASSPLCALFCRRSRRFSIPC